MFALGHQAADFFASARSTCAVLAPVGQGDARLNAGQQNVVALLDIELTRAGLNGDGKGHGLF